jgi:WD40 repeat protein
MTKGLPPRHASPTIPSSPPQLPAGSPRSRRSTKLKKPPPITPKRFSRFFTPRPSSTRLSNSRSSRQLRDITKSAVNRSAQIQLRTPVSVKSLHENGHPSLNSTPAISSAKRKLDQTTPPTSPIFYSSPSKRPKLDRTPVSKPVLRSSPPPLPDICEDKELSLSGNGEEGTTGSLEASEIREVTFCSPVKRLTSSLTTLRIAERSFGGLATSGRRSQPDPCVGTDYTTRNFVSTENDIHRTWRKNIPFSATSCNTNSLAAVATESGTVRIIDTDMSARFKKCHIIFQPLQNAITDMAFSSDDSTLVAGCGDKSIRLIDMQSQKVKMVFTDHRGCIKQVRFRPGDDHMIASCCREGIVNLWDSRCRGEQRPVFSNVATGDTRDGIDYTRFDYKAEHLFDPIRSWPRAHSDRLNMGLLNGPNAVR